MLTHDPPSKQQLILSLLGDGKKPYDHIYHSAELRLMYPISELPLNRVYQHDVNVITWPFFSQENRKNEFTSAQNMLRGCIQLLHIHIQTFFPFLNVICPLHQKSDRWHFFLSPPSPSNFPCFAQVFSLPFLIPCLFLSVGLHIITLVSQRKDIHRGKKILSGFNIFSYILFRLDQVTPHLSDFSSLSLKFFHQRNQLILSREILQ